MVQHWLDDQPLGRLFLLVYLCSIVFALVTGVSFAFRSGVAALDYDEWEYWQLSTGLLAGTFDDPGRRTLAYPTLLAMLRLIREDYAFVQAIVTALAATAPPLLTWAMLRLGAARLAAVLSGLGLAVWPPHVFLATSFYSEAVTLPVFLLFLGLLPRRDQAAAARWGRWLLCGILLGVTAHIRTMYQLFVPVVLLILLFDGWPWREAIGRWLLVVLGFLAVVLPWSFYVSSKLGAPVLLTANGGETLAGGFTPALYRHEGRTLHMETRSTWVGPGKWLPAAETGYLSVRETALPYPEQDLLLRERTLQWLIANPQDAFHITIRKLALQWGFYPLDRNGPMHLLMGSIPSMILLVLFLATLILSPAGRRLGARFWLMPLFVAGIAVISWGSWRFRHPADAAMIAVVVAGLTAWVVQRLTAISHNTQSEGIAADV